MAQDKHAQLRNFIAGYRDSMMLSDIKALIAVLFVAIMMGTVLQYRQHYPWYLTPLVILDPVPDHLSEPAGFGLSAVSPHRAEALSYLAQCGSEAILTSSPTSRLSSKGCLLYAQGLSRILWWKNITLLTANLLSIACLAAAVILLFVSWV